MEVGPVAVLLEQRPQGFDVVSGGGDVVPGVRPEPPPRLGAVVADHAGMDGHHQSVVHAHAGHLHEHVAGEDVRLLRREIIPQSAVEQARRLVARQVDGERLEHPVVGGDGAVTDEVCAATGERVHVGAVIGDRGTRPVGEPLDVLLPRRRGRGDVGVRPERRDDATRERPVGGQGVVHGEVVERVVGGGEHLDPELLEKGAGPEARLAKPRLDEVEQPVGVLGRRMLVDAEQLHERVLQPVPRRGAGVEVPVLAEGAPHRARRRGRPSRRIRDAETCEVDAGRVHQPRDVVVEPDEQLGGVSEGCVPGEDARVDVPVR